MPNAKPRRRPPLLQASGRALQGATLPRHDASSTGVVVVCSLRHRAQRHGTRAARRCSSETQSGEIIWDGRIRVCACVREMCVCVCMWSHSTRRARRECSSLSSSTALARRGRSQTANVWEHADPLCYFERTRLAGKLTRSRRPGVAWRSGAVMACMRAHSSSAERARML